MTNRTSSKLKQQNQNSTTTCLVQTPDNKLNVASNANLPFSANQNSKHRVAPDFGDLSTSQIIDNLPDELELQKMFGVKSSTATRGLLMSALQGLGVGGANYRSFVLSMGSELEPADAIEAMLVRQMAVTHTAMMTSAGGSLCANSDHASESYDRIMNRLGRTFVMQVEALKKYRKGLSQTIRVEHVTVNAGGKAIVGDFKSGGVDREK